MKKSKISAANGKRKMILEAAERLFSERSFGQTQISEIAKAAGVGIGTFYRYFPDKEALLTELLTTLFADVRGELAETRRGIETWSPLEQIASIRRTFEVSFRVMLARPKLMLTFLRSGYGGGEKVSEAVWKMLCRIIEDMAEDIGRAEKAGIAEIPDKVSVGHAIIGMVLQLSHRIIVEGKPSVEHAVNLCTRLTFGMLFSFVDPARYEQYLPIYPMILPPLDGNDANDEE
jgi:AcrR family transcriptional regulator